MTIGTDISSWLHSLGYDARPAVSPLRIGSVSYVGAEYRHDTVQRLYLLGDLPACYRRSSRVVFRIPHDERDWFVATYSDAAPSHPNRPPFGPFFILHPWTAPEPIDRYERTPRKRVKCEWSAT